MAYELRNNEGSLFRDKARKSDRHPEFTGTALVDGKEYWLSAWVNESKKDGAKFFSVKFKAKDAPRDASAGKPAVSYAEELSDEIPF